MEDLPANRESSSSQGPLPSQIAPPVDRAAPKRRFNARNGLALAGAILFLLFLACDYALRGTLSLPINTHLKVSFTNERMVVESASIPRVNGVHFDM